MKMYLYEDNPSLRQVAEVENLEAAKDLVGRWILAGTYPPHCHPSTWRAVADLNGDTQTSWEEWCESEFWDESHRLQTICRCTADLMGVRVLMREEWRHPHPNVTLAHSSINSGSVLILADDELSRMEILELESSCLGRLWNIEIHGDEIVSIPMSEDEIAP